MKLSRDELTQFLLRGWRQVSRRPLLNEEQTKLMSYYDEIHKMFWHSGRNNRFLFLLPSKRVISCDAFVDEHLPNDCEHMVFEGEEIFYCTRKQWNISCTAFFTPRTQYRVHEAPFGIFHALNTTTEQWRECE